MSDVIPNLSATHTNFTFNTSTGVPRSSIILPNVPMPPSSNTQYKLCRRGGKTYHVPSAGLVKFKTEMYQYSLTQPRFLQDKQRAQEWNAQGQVLEIRTLFMFHHSSIFTKKGTVKRLDTSNRIKALHDQVSLYLGIDDRIFFRVYAEKAEVADNLPEMVFVEILPILSPPIIHSF